MMVGAWSFRVFAPSSLAPWQTGPIYYPSVGKVYFNIIISPQIHSQLFPPPPPPPPPKKKKKKKKKKIQYVC